MARSFKSFAACGGSFILAAALSACNKSPDVQEAQVSSVKTEQTGVTPSESSTSSDSPADALQDITHTGDLIVNNVTAGVKITVKDGGLRVLGTVGDKAQLNQQSGASGIVVNGNGNVVIQNSGSTNIYVTGKIIVNGVDVTAQVQSQSASAKSQIQGIEILGDAGNHVHVKSSSQIAMKNAGTNANIHAGNTVIMLDVGENSSVVAGNSIRVGLVGEKSTVKAGNSLDAEGFCAHSFVAAGNSVSAKFVDSTTRITAGNSMQVTGSKALPCRP